MIGTNLETALGYRDIFGSTRKIVNKIIPIKTEIIRKC